MASRRIGAAVIDNSAIGAVAWEEEEAVAAAVALVEPETIAKALKVMAYAVEG